MAFKVRIIFFSRSWCISEIYNLKNQAILNGKRKNSFVSVSKSNFPICVQTYLSYLVCLSKRDQKCWFVIIIRYKPLIYSQRCIRYNCSSCIFHASSVISTKFSNWIIMPFFAYTLFRTTRLYVMPCTRVSKYFRSNGTAV